MSRSSEFVREHLYRAPRHEQQAPWTLPDQALRFDSTQQAQQIITDSGNRVFDVASVEHSGLRIEGGLHDSRFFVTSADGWAAQDRTYAVNWASRAPGEDHVMLERFDDVFSSKGEAVALAREAATRVPADRSLTLDMRAPSQRAGQLERGLAPTPNPIRTVTHPTR